MWKNMLLSLGAHIVAAAICSITIFFIADVQFLLNPFVVILIILLYILFGIYILKDFGTIGKNIVSVLPVFILGISLLIYCINSTQYPHVPSPWGSRWNWLLIYLPYISPFAYFYYRFSVNNVKLVGDVFAGIYSIIPSFLFMIGILLKKYVNSKTIKS